MSEQASRQAGILLHPTSLPSPHGIGDLGRGARQFIDWLADAGMQLWQILPLVPPGPGFSPYSTLSALAGNPWLIDLQQLVADGLLPADSLDGAGHFSQDRVDPAAMIAFKAPRLEAAAEALLDGANPGLADALESFVEASPWVADTALFVALKTAASQRPWWQWEPALRDRQPSALARARQDLRRDIGRNIAQQFLFDRQWGAVRAYAAERGISVIGDIPFYVDRDSVDVWAAREQFRLDADGRPLAVAGVPPDFFSELGQLWGNPLYDWDKMAADGHRWWVARMKRSLELADVVRIDHFRGFAAFWEVPPDADDARPGRWVPGPGARLFDDLSAALGDLPLIAEDLGVVDDDVIALLQRLGLPGMRVLQFAFGDSASHPFLPHNYVAHSVAYTATHDNDTTLGWWRATSDTIRDHVRRYLAVSGHDVVWDLIRAAFRSVAERVVIPLQDVLTLDSGARMNVPGTVEGNWLWRVRGEAFNAPLAARLRSLTELYGRLGSP